MKLKKFLALGVTVVMSTGMLAGCGNKSENTAKKNDKIVIGMVTDVGGVNDHSFNQSAWEGLEKLKKEVGADKIDVKYLESKQESDYAANLESFHDQEPDLIIGVGYKLSKDVKEAAKNYPDQQYAIIDDVVEADNVTSLTFEANVSGYLAGLVAGKMADSDKVGFLGGIESSVLGEFEYGYMAGVAQVNKDTGSNVTVSSQYANAFDQPAKGKDIASRMYNDGINVIFACAGDTGNGAIEVAKENKKRIIGVDRDQYSQAPDNILTSAMKNIDSAVYNLGKEVVDGKFKGGKTIENTLAMDGVGLAPTTSKNVAPDVLEYVKSKEEKIKSGDIKVPGNEKDYKAFVEGLK